MIALTDCEDKEIKRMVRICLFQLSTNVFFVLKRLFFSSPLYLLCFLSFCTQNNGIADKTLIQEKDARKEFSTIFFIKAMEYFPKDAVYTERTLFTSTDRCKRHVFYDKNAFKNCMREITLFNFSPSSIGDFIQKMDIYVRDGCKLKKIILFKDSLTKGEFNICELNE